MGDDYMNNSKNFYKKLISTYLGIIIMVIAMLGMVIISLVIKDDNLSGMITFIFACFGIVGLLFFIFAGNFNMLFSLYRNHGGKISLMYDYKKVGVPNNSYEEFKLEFVDIVKGDIKLKETAKGIYEGTINEKNIVLDMTGWLNRKYYLYEYFLTIIQLKFAKNDKMQLSNPHKCNVQEVNLFIEELSGRKHKKSLISNCMSQLTFKFKERIKIKSSQVFEKKISIHSLYDFNKKN